MAKRLAAYWAIVLIVVLLVGTVVIVDRSQEFQTCINKSQNQQQTQAAHQSVSIFSTPGVYQDCLGEFVTTNNPAIGALSTVVIAIFTIVLASVTHRQARLTKEALIADKAAFVFATNFAQFWTLDAATNTYNWRFRVSWKNSGDTGAKDVIVHAQCDIRNTAYPRGYAFDYSVGANPTGFLGPGVENLGGVTPPVPQAAVSAQDIRDAIAGNKFIYLWGWARYRDVFPGTPRHITKFCWYVVFQGDPFAYVPHTQGPPGTTGTLHFSYVQHAEGNTAEDE